MAEPADTRSRRSALRFSGFDIPISYKTEYEDGEALLINISTSGCAIRQTSTELHLEQKLLITLTLGGLRSLMQVRAVVIRSENDSVALHFQHVDEDFKRRLVRFFAQETRRRKAEPTASS